MPNLLDRQLSLPSSAIIDWRDPVRRESPQAIGLAAWWPTLTQPGLGVLRDEASLGNDGIFGATTTAPIWAVDPTLGACLQFTAANASQVNVTDNSWLRPASQSFAFACWYKGTGTNQANTVFAGKYHGTSPYLGWYLSQAANSWTGTTGKTIGAVYFTSGTQGLVVNTTGALDDGNWHHLCVTYDLTQSFANIISIYWDGISQTLTTNLNSGATASFTNTDPLRIGTYNGTTGNAWNGTLADMRYYVGAIPTPGTIYQMYSPETRWELYRTRPLESGYWPPVVIENEFWGSQVRECQLEYVAY